MKMIDFNNKLNKLVSNIEFINDPVIVGIDEAGRGPVIGPMVYSVLVMSPDKVTDYKDSKLLTPIKRKEIFEKMNNFAFKIIDPIYITMCMERGIKNLNEIAKEAVVDLLNEVKSKCKNVQTVFIDGLGNNEKYKSHLLNFFNYNFIIENQADSTYQVVSGASIVAKNIRDNAVNKLICGSGYPSDPNTKKWIKNHINKNNDLPEIVRHSWKTIKNLYPSNKSKSFSGYLKDFYINKE